MSNEIISKDFSYFWKFLWKIISYFGQSYDDYKAEIFALVSNTIIIFIFLKFVVNRLYGWQQAGAVTAFIFYLFIWLCWLWWKIKQNYKEDEKC